MDIPPRPLARATLAQLPACHGMPCRSRAKSNRFGHEREPETRVFGDVSARELDIMRGTISGARVWLVLVAVMGTSSGDEWATIRGRIVYDGTPPVPEPIVVDKDVEVWGEKELIDESLLVHPESRGVRNVIVQLALGRGETVDIHPDNERDARGSSCSGMKPLAMCPT